MKKNKLNLFSHYICTIFIIVHGTWAAKESWYMPGGDFFIAMEESCNEHQHVIPFHWTGQFCYEERERAATALVKLIKSYPHNYKIVLVGHSHGGNVCILASQMLGKQKKRTHSIQALYTLATPVSLKNYVPNMDVVRYHFNFFAFEDFIQPQFGVFNREYPQHARTANLRLTIDGQPPDHSEIHGPLLGLWIPHLENMLLNPNEQNPSFKKFNFIKDGIIHFYSDKNPVYEYDYKRQEMRDIDKFIVTINAYNTAIRSKISAHANSSQQISSKKIDN